MSEQEPKSALNALLEALNIPPYAMQRQLKIKERCPHCSIPHPGFERWWETNPTSPSNDGSPEYKWAVYACNSCGGMVLARARRGDTGDDSRIEQFIPAPRAVDQDIPLPARTYLDQAISTLHAPDAAAVMAGSAVDSMLKVLGYEKGSVYSRIDQAVAEHKITAAMGEWAHAVRLGANRPRHADLDEPHVSPAEAKQSVEFAEAFGYFLFVLTKRVERGRQAAAKTLAKPTTT